MSSERAGNSCVPAIDPESAPREGSVIEQVPDTAPAASSERSNRQLPPSESRPVHVPEITGVSGSVEPQAERAADSASAKTDGAARRRNERKPRRGLTASISWPDVHERTGGSAATGERGLLRKSSLRTSRTGPEAPTPPHVTLAGARSPESAGKMRERRFAFGIGPSVACQKPQHAGFPVPPFVLRPRSRSSQMSDSFLGAHLIPPCVPSYARRPAPVSAKFPGRGDSAKIEMQHSCRFRVQAPGPPRFAASSGSG